MDWNWNYRPSLCSFLHKYDNKDFIYHNEQLSIAMISPTELELLSCEELLRIEADSAQILTSITNSEVNSVKAMVLPPVFSFNVLKLALLLHDPSLNPTQITWQKVRKDLLRRLDIFVRKCENIRIYEIPEEEIERIESVFRESYSSLGENLEKKSELYGNFIHRMCQWTLRMRSLMHASKYSKMQD